MPAVPEMTVEVVDAVTFSRDARVPGWPYNGGSVLKRKETAMSAQEQIGKLADAKAQRDAIHVAIAPVVAAEILYPAQRIGFATDGDTTKVRAGGKVIGIVDPFLSHPVHPGDWFYMVLMPNTITSLHHVWTHPAFGDAAPAQAYLSPAEQAEAMAKAKSESETWLKDFCAANDCPRYEMMIEGLRALNDGNRDSWRQGDDYYGLDWDGDYLTSIGTDAHGDIPPEFWHHVERVLGKPVRMKPSSFSCSC